MLAIACAPPVVSAPPEPAPADTEAETEPEVPAPAPVVASRDLSTQLDGRAFPEHVLALTWDDGPDTWTLTLAEYLRREHVSATFFVVGAWVDGVSADPGAGKGVYASGAEFLPVLGDLVQLGHRLGNHTQNHELLWGAPRAVVREQLEANQRRVDPFLDDELALFRAPGGAWNGAAADAAAEDPGLLALVGPIRWDVDRKDWDASLRCISARPHQECERAGPGRRLRVKPAVVAARYLDSIEATGHGIVLLHDRVGHVGSKYALQVAEALIPPLKAKGYVFAAPVLRFSPLRPRFPDAPEDLELLETEHIDALALGDIDGDGRADLCARERDAPDVVCAMARGAGEPATPAVWSSELASTATGRLRFADLDGDARADVCLWSGRGVSCARSRGDGFDRARVWLAGGDAAWGATFQLGDVDGDGRADACGRTKDGLSCAPSTGTAFGRLRPWSLGADFADGGTLRLGDVNGDGRADACARGPHGVSCALSTGRAFTSATMWMAEGMKDEDGWRAREDTLVLADVNGDGRADLCGAGPEGVVCGMAP